MRPGKTPISCIPCAKRKVRCDKQQPCCHCKRRPQDTCEYPRNASVPNSPQDDLNGRILELERHIRSLGGDPKDAHQSSPTDSRGAAEQASPRRLADLAVPDQSSIDAAKAHGKTSSLVAHGEEATFIESPMWYSWGGLNQPDEDIPATFAKGTRLPPSAARTSYLPSILDPINVAEHNRLDPFQIPTEHINTLWKTFLANVHPLVKIFFDWEVEPIIHKARDNDSSLSNPERALVFSIIFMSITSLSADQCSSLLHSEQTQLLDRFHRATETALLLAGYATTTNRLTLQAFILYLIAISDRAHPAAIYSLIGVAVRIAERMGLHCDGELLGLSILRSEERRRIWWQLQYVELMAARFVGNVCLNLFADWNTRMPANLEDKDLGPDTETMPPERTKLTSMSHCLWSYDVLQMHRNIRREQNGYKSMAWALSQKVPLSEKDAMVDEMESTLRAKYIQHCDPMEPLHVSLQLGICQFILAGRRLMRQPALVNARISDMSRQERDQFLAICTKGLEYCNVFQTNECLRGYLWHNRIYFHWVAFVYVILEAHHRFDEDAVVDLWALIGKTYTAQPELRNAVHREDINFAAQITFKAWKKYASRTQTQCSTEVVAPEWILELCENFGLARPDLESAETDKQLDPTTNYFMGAEFDFDMVDWSTWDEMYMGQGLYATTS